MVLISINSGTERDQLIYFSETTRRPKNSPRLSKSRPILEKSRAELLKQQKVFSTPLLSSRVHVASFFAPIFDQRKSLAKEDTLLPEALSKI